MKEIKAIIQSFMVDDVLDALAQIPDLPGVTLSHVLGWGKARAAGAENPIHLGAHALASKTKLEMVVTDEALDQVLDTIASAAHTCACQPPSSRKRRTVADGWKVVDMRT